MLLAAAAAAAAAIAFAPPLDRPLRYAIEERRGDDRYRMIETATFARDGDGFTVTIVPVALEAAGDARGRIEAGMRPWIGTPLRIRLSAAGDPVAAIDPQATWDRLIAGFRAMGAGAVAEGFARMPATDRATQILQAADDLLATGLPALVPGATIATRDGEATRTAADRYVLRRGPSAASPVEMVDTIDVSAETGLVERRERSRVEAGRIVGETRIAALPG